MRLFVCVTLPPDLREALARTAAPMRRRWPRLRWVPSEQFHVTLWFIGEAPPERQPALADALRRSVRDIPPFTARLSSWGGFPDHASARVLWVGVDAADLSRLEARMRAVAAELDMASDTRPFLPHVTLARSRGPLDVSMGNPSLPAVPWTVRDVVVMESRTTGGAVEYRPVDRVALEAA